MKVSLENDYSRNAVQPVYVPAINSIILRLAPQAVIPISHRSFSVSEGKVAMSTSWDVNRPGKQKTSGMYNEQANKLDYTYVIEMCVYAYRSFVAIVRGKGASVFTSTEFKKVWNRYENT